MSQVKSLFTGENNNRKICSFSFQEFADQVKSFHGYMAPGVIIGGFMVDMALKNLPEGEFFDAISETRACLPDAIQILTPCTIGNGWLKVINLGRFALIFYEKYGGAGIRIFLDQNKMDVWAELKTWFMKLKPKQEQDSQLLLEQIRDAGTTVMSTQQVQVKPYLLGAKHRKGFIICSICTEPYPIEDGKVCLACQGEAPYVLT